MSMTMLFSTTYGTIYSRTATSDSLTLGRCHSIHGVHEIIKMTVYFVISLITWSTRNHQNEWFFHDYTYIFWIEFPPLLLGAITQTLRIPGVHIRPLLGIDGNPLFFWNGFCGTFWTLRFWTISRFGENHHYYCFLTHSWGFQAQNVTKWRKKRADIIRWPWSTLAYLHFQPSNTWFGS